VKQIRKRLTYANVMSSLAVFLVLGGATAFAATKIGGDEIKANAISTGKIKKEAVTTSKLKNSSVSTSKIADDAVTGAKINEATLGQVPSANTANSAKTADTANSAKTADTATSAGSAPPEVFAKIENNGSVVADLSKGLTSANVTNPAAGVYCITVPSFVPKGGQATTQFGGSYGFGAQLSVGGTGFCPAPAVQVITSGGASPPTPGNATFYVALYH
jgi:hypothetical protein